MTHPGLINRSLLCRCPAAPTPTTRGEKRGRVRHIAVRPAQAPNPVLAPGGRQSTPGRRTGRCGGGKLTVRAAAAPARHKGDIAEETAVRPDMAGVLDLTGGPADHVAADLAPAAAFLAAAQAGPLEHPLVEGGLGLAGGESGGRAAAPGGGRRTRAGQRPQVRHGVGGREEAHPTLAVHPCPQVVVMTIGRLLPRLAIKNPPKKTHPKTQKNYLKNRLKMFFFFGFFYIFYFFMKIIQTFLFETDIL